MNVAALDIVVLAVDSGDFLHRLKYDWICESRKHKYIQLKYTFIEVIGSAAIFKDVKPT